MSDPLAEALHKVFAAYTDDQRHGWEADDYLAALAIADPVLASVGRAMPAAARAGLGGGMSLERVLARIEHAECLDHWSRLYRIDPDRQFTQHGWDAHLTTAKTGLTTPEGKALAELVAAAEAWRGTWGTDDLDNDAVDETLVAAIDRYREATRRA